MRLVFHAFEIFPIPNILPIFPSLPSDSGVAALHSCIFKITWKDLLQIMHLAFLPKASFLSFHLKLVVPSMRFWRDFNLTTTLPPFDGQCCYQSGRAVRVVRTAPPLVNQSNGELGQAQFLEREQGHVTWLHSFWSEDGRDKGDEWWKWGRMTKRKIVRSETAALCHMGLKGQCRIYFHQSRIDGKIGMWSSSGVSPCGV